MHQTRFIVRALPVALLWLAGCAGSDHFKEGQRLMNAGQHDQAVAAFRKAVDASPNNAHYQINLDDAESAAATAHIAAAEKLLAAGHPQEARSELETALNYMPANPKAIVLMEKIDAAAPVGSEAVAAADPSAKTAPATHPAPLTAAVAAADQNPPALKPVEKNPPASRPAPVALQKLPPPAPPAPDSTDSPSIQTPESFAGTLSRDDDRHPSEIQAVDGIVVKLRDTAKDPLRADVELRVGSIKKRYDDVRVGTRIRGRGASRQQYDFTILRINDSNETVEFALDPIREKAPPGKPDGQK